MNPTTDHELVRDLYVEAGDEFHEVAGLIPGRSRFVIIDDEGYSFLITVLQDGERTLIPILPTSTAVH